MTFFWTLSYTHATLDNESLSRLSYLHEDPTLSSKSFCPCVGYIDVILPAKNEMTCPESSQETVHHQLQSYRWHENSQTWHGKTEKRHDKLQETLKLGLSRAAC